jgi:hypothetical protein
VAQPAVALSGSGAGPGGGCLIPSTAWLGGAYQSDGGDTCTWTWGNLAGNSYVQVTFNGLDYQVIAGGNTGSPTYGPVLTGALSCVAGVITGTVSVPGEAPCGAETLILTFG